MLKMTRKFIINSYQIGMFTCTQYSFIVFQRTTLQTGNLLLQVCSVWGVDVFCICQSICVDNTDCETEVAVDTKGNKQL